MNQNGCTVLIFGWFRLKTDLESSNLCKLCALSSNKAVLNLCSARITDDVGKSLARLELFSILAMIK